MPTARAILVHAFGGPEQLQAGPHEIAAPGPGEALVEVAAIGVNFLDVHECAGLPPYDQRGFPFVPGSEGAGIVRAIGAGVREVAVGDRVAWWVPRSGSYAGQVIVPADRLIPVPARIDLDVAAAVVVQGLTAQYLATSTFPVAPGDPVVIHAAAGGVGLLLTQMVKMRGGIVVATASTREKREAARAAGADLAVAYAELLPAVESVSGGRGAAVVYDSVGLESVESSLAALRERGTLVLYGASSGKAPPLDLQRLAALGSLYVTHPALRSYIATRADLLARASALFDWIGLGQLGVRIDKRFALEDAHLAHKALHDRRTTGKLLLTPGPLHSG